MPVPVFTSGEVLTAANMNKVGLWKIADTTFTNSANPFINGCFSNSFQNYRVLIVAYASSPTDVYARFRSGASTPETGAVYDRFGFQSTGAYGSMVLANQVAMGLADVTNTGNNRTTIELEISSVFESVPTIVRCRGWGSNTGFSYYPDFRVETNTAYTGIELTSLSTPTLTGTMRVYGYRD